MEVEVKFKVEDFSGIKSKLKALGAKFLVRQHEKDVYFTPFSEEETLRVRYTDSGKLLTYKRLVHNTETQSAIEVEARVDGDIEKILTSVGHSVVIVKEKDREMYSINGMTVNLDDVVGLGKFVEIEYIGNQEAGENSLRSLAVELDLSWEDRITKPYIRQLLELKE